MNQRAILIFISCLYFSCYAFAQAIDRQYWPNGKLKSYTKYKTDKRIYQQYDSAFTWYENGVVETVAYDSAGIRVGRSYWDNGRPKGTTFWNGQEFGTWKYWYPNGTMSRLIVFCDYERAICDEKNYFHNGNLRTHLSRIKKDGVDAWTTIEFDSLGNKLKGRKEVYKNNTVSQKMNVVYQGKDSLITEMRQDCTYYSNGNRVIIKRKNGEMWRKVVLNPQGELVENLALKDGKLQLVRYTMRINLMPCSKEELEKALIVIHANEFVPTDTFHYDKQQGCFICGIPTCNSIANMTIACPGYDTLHLKHYPMPHCSSNDYGRSCGTISFVMGKKGQGSFMNGDAPAFYDKHPGLAGVVLRSYKPADRNSFLLRVRKLGLKEDTSLYKELVPNECGYNQDSLGFVVVKIKGMEDITRLRMDSMVSACGSICGLKKDNVSVLINKIHVVAGSHFDRKDAQKMAKKYGIKFDTLSLFNEDVSSYGHSWGDLSIYEMDYGTEWRNKVEFSVDPSWDAEQVNRVAERIYREEQVIRVSVGVSGNARGCYRYYED